MVDLTLDDLQADIHEAISYDRMFDIETDPEFIEYAKNCGMLGLDIENTNLEQGEFETLEEKHKDAPWIAKWARDKQHNRDLDMGHYDSGELREIF